MHVWSNIFTPSFGRATLSMVGRGRKVYLLTVKDQVFCCKPVVVVFWSSWSPARSLAPVVTTALYLVPLAKTVVEDPKGLSVAVSPSMLRLTLTLVICVVPLEVTFNSLKVVGFMEELIIFSEKVAVMLAEGAIPVAFAVGEVLVTLGDVVSGGGSVVKDQTLSAASGLPTESLTPALPPLTL